MEEGDGAGDVWIWRRDEGWRKAMEQEMCGSGGGWRVKEDDGSRYVLTWRMGQGEWIDDEVVKDG